MDYPHSALLQSGCVECVWEVYQQELLQYQRALAKAKGQPEPKDPFEELEQQLYGQANNKETERTNTSYE